MKRLFKVLAWLTGLWLLSSFLGVMFNPSQASLWTQSLMWALLASVILAPALLFVLTAPSSSDSPQQPEKSFGDSSSQKEDEFPNYSAEEESTYSDR